MLRISSEQARRLVLVALAFLVTLGGCVTSDTDTEQDAEIRSAPAQLLEPPMHAPGEPHPFIECSEGVCPRDQPAHLFSGEFHESVVDLRVESCTVGLDLVWARRYRSRLPMPTGQTPLGNGWDHSYNIYLELDPTGAPIMTVHDGNARPAEFTVDPASGIWTASKYHRSGAYDANGRFVMTFADGGQWIFKSAAQSASPLIRRLWRIVDRNGNIVELEYDVNDRLERVVNASGQSLELSYDTADHIISVIAELDASTQREVTYEYYGSGDPDGNLHDLERVTMPAVVGTVTGNNFPSGTSTVYTYSIGSTVPELNGNLLTIEDGLGQVYLQNTYATTTSSTNINFDRLVEQVWGDPGDLIALSYVTLRPAAGNEYAVSKTWVNDRVGRVTENFFNADNQLVIVRQYTGFADPDLPTTDTSNLPTGKLRAGDPTYFETRYGYNADGHVAWVLHPRGTKTVSVYEADINASAAPQIRGNQREVHRYTNTCATGIAPISEYYEYQAGRGNEHGEREFVTRVTDPLGNITEMTYDAAGNRLSTEYSEPNTREDMEYSAIGQLTRHRFPEDQHGGRREIVYTYANDGHLRTETVDPLGLALTTTREYDVACNEARVVDPRGSDKLYTYNERNELIREQSEEVTCSATCGGGTPTRSNTDRIYDANMNLVRVDYQARDCDGSLQANAVVSTTIEYDILNEEVATRSELAPGQELVNTFELDANREVVEVAYGEAAAGSDPSNTETKVYDERGMLFREIRGAGSTEVSTTQHDYDGNGNEILTSVGLEGPVRTTSHVYDCFDRVIETVDPMGNQTEFDYDAASNVTEQRFYGELVDVAGATNNVLVARTTTDYDTMRRPIEVIRDHFNPATQVAIGDGQSVTSLTYDGESRVIVEEDDNGGQTSRDYDAAGRLITTVDAAGNMEELVYDAAGNMITRELTDVPSTSGPSQVGIWTAVYDEQNYLTEREDPMGNSWHACYDSLGRLVEEVDARGNRTLHEYDGHGRLLDSTYVLTDDGTGAGTVVGTAVVAQVWDDSDRLITREDPNGNVTTYAYDSLNRLTLETFADGTTNEFVYDVHGNTIERTDTNGTISTMTYDGLERLTDVSINHGPTVDTATTFEEYEYEARSMTVGASDDDSEIVRSHDSLGALLQETQTYSPTAVPGTPYTVSYTRDGLGSATTTNYPGGRQIDRSFDGLRRTRLISEGVNQLVDLQYLGPNVAHRIYTQANVQSDYAYDLARRMTDSEHDDLGGGTIDHRSYTFDETNNKTSEQDLGPGSLAGVRSMEHDSLGRMVDSDVSGSAATDRSVDYVLDPAGNRTNVSGDTCSGGYTQVGSDALVNQYTDTACEDWSHDDAGNLVESVATAAAGRDRSFEYDHRGRLVEVWIDAGTPAEVSFRFDYDASGRKIHSTRTDVAGTTGELYVYDGGNVIEEYVDGGSGVAATYLYGDDLDDRLQMVRGSSWWYLDDELGSTTALVHRTMGGSLDIERYAYQDYGDPIYFFAGLQVAASVSGNPYLFAGSRWLSEPGLYDMRTRHFDVVAGRFISRDSVGIWGDEENLGNGYTYVSNAPDTHVDPTGRFKKPKVKNCHDGAQATIETTLDDAERLAKVGSNWFGAQADRKRKHRKKDWNNNKNDGRDWWGKYYNVRFNRIKNNYGKIVRRCSKNVITFKCRSTGYCGNDESTVAWTLSTWHDKIRLCKNNNRGYFTSGGALRGSEQTRGATVMHEVSHNINAIGDKDINGSAVDTPGEAQDLADEHPTRASWSAENYEQFSLSSPK